MSSGSADEATFVMRHRVRYREVDQQGVVFNGHWLGWFDDAFTDFLLAIGVDVATDEEPFEPMLVHAEIDWTGPAGFDDEVAIAVRPVRVGGSSFDLRFDATVEGRDVCGARITYVSVDAEAHSPTSLPDGVRRELESRGARGSDG